MKLLFSTLLSLFLTISFSQGVLIDTSINSSLDPSAIFEVKSQSKGVLLPRMTALERISIVSPQTGLLVFDLDLASLFFYDGSDWVEFAGGKKGLRDLDFDTSIRVQTSLDDDTIRFKVDNHEVMKIHDVGVHINDGRDNLFLGQSGFPNLNTSARWNVALGKNSMASLKEGIRNVAIGTNALDKIEDEWSNVAIGYSAMSGATGEKNTALGAIAGSYLTGSFNLVLGFAAGAIASGSNNILVGSNAGASISGSNSICIGENSGTNSSGNRNIFIGNGMGIHENESDLLIIENSDASDPLVVGNFLYHTFGINGRVAINHDQPNSDLHVKHQDLSYSSGFRLENAWTGEYWRMFVRKENGNLRFYSKEGGINYVAWVDNSSGEWHSTSDRRKKKDFEALEDNVLDKIKQIQILKYHFKTEDELDKKHIGVLAQEVEPHFPEVVHFDEEADLYTINYNAFGPIAMKAIQELADENQSLKDQIKSIEQKMDEILMKIK